MTCGLVWLLGLATIGLAVAGRVPPPQFVTSYMALGPLFGMPAALLGARIVQQRHGHRMGWILLAMGLTQTIAQTANAIPGCQSIATRAAFPAPRWRPG